MWCRENSSHRSVSNCMPQSWHQLRRCRPCLLWSETVSCSGQRPLLQQQTPCHVCVSSGQRPLVPQQMPCHVCVCSEQRPLVPQQIPCLQFRSARVGLLRLLGPPLLIYRAGTGGGSSPPRWIQVKDRERRRDRLKRGEA